MKKIGVVVAGIFVLAVWWSGRGQFGQREELPKEVMQVEPEPELKSEVEPESEPEPEPKPEPKKWQMKMAKKGKKIPLTVGKGKKTVGWVRVNQVERLRFADFTNTKAIAASVNCSYSINMTIYLTRKAERFTCCPVFKKGGNEVSSPADLGWSGFPTELSCYGKRCTETIEVGVQPEQRGKGSLILQFEDESGTKYDSVKVDRKTVKKAKKGPKLLKAGKQVKVRSVCGAVYSVVPTAVHREVHLTGNGTQTASFLDIGYTVTGWKKPKKGRTVANISGLGKDARLVCSVGLGVQIASSAKVMRNSFASALRKETASSSQVQQYVFNGGFVSFGYYKDLWTNRKLDMETVQPDFVRVRLEFTDEASARTRKEKLKFRGRFLVYEIKVTSRF